MKAPLNLSSIWHDPVWSKVVATGIVAAITEIVVLVAGMHKVDQLFYMVAGSVVAFFLLGLEYISGKILELAGTLNIVWEWSEVDP